MRLKRGVGSALDDNNGVAHPSNREVGKTLCRSVILF